MGRTRLIAFALLSGLAAQESREYTGVLGTDLVVPPATGQIEPLAAGTDDDRHRLPAPLSIGDRLWVGSIRVRRGAPLWIAVVEPTQGKPYLYADINGDGRCTSEERFPMDGPAVDPGTVGEAVLHLPLTASRYKSYPVRIAIFPQRDANGAPVLVRSPFAFAEGTVDIAGRKTLVWYLYDLEKGGVYPDWGWQGVDVNGDGRIETGANSPEYVFANDEAIIYTVNGHKVSTRLINLDTGEIVLREHPPSSDQRIYLTPGTSVPDFAFTDQHGGKRKLSEFAGKYVLIDFWGAWCAPCRRELGRLESIQQRLGPRQLVVLGIADDADPADTQKALKETSVTYTQALGLEARKLSHRRFRINAFPTHLLLDPERKIVDTGGQALHGEEMERTLDRILPRASTPVQ